MAQTMSKARVNVQLCKACLRCLAHCPKHAVFQLEQLNRKGYKTVGVNEEKCSGCGICYTVCPDYCFEIR